MDRGIVGGAIITVVSREWTEELWWAIITI